MTLAARKLQAQVVVDNNQFDRVAYIKRRGDVFQQFVKLAVDGAG
jgi:hypothetical protein